MRPRPRSGAPPGQRGGPTRNDPPDEALANQVATTATLTYADRVAERTDSPPSTRGAAIVDPQLVTRAAELVDTIGDQAARDAEQYERGWRDAARRFFNHGVDVGRRAVLEEIAAQDRADARRLLADYDERRAARREQARPSRCRCGRCSACIHRSAVARRGGDYTGGPVRWEGTA